MKALELLQQFNLEGMEFTENPQFGWCDSGALYSMLKIYRPRQYIEVGCGYSTGIAAQVVEGEIVCIDPDPRAPVKGVADVHIAKCVETLEVSTFKDADVLFIDSSHRVDSGDVPFLFDEVLPVLKPGALVHWHDIFLPWDYPEAWKPRMYTEQYMLRDFLEGNDDYETLWPGYQMYREHPGEMLEVFGRLAGSGSYWVQKCKN